MQFVDTIDGPLVNLSDVVAIKRMYKKDPAGRWPLDHYCLHMRDGSVYKANDSSFFPEFLSGEVIAAGPNDYATQVLPITVWEGDKQTKGYVFNRLKVVGWRIEGRVAHPIVPSGSDFGIAAGEIYVETPDGKYDSLWGDVYDSLADLSAAYASKPPVKTND